MCVRRLCDMCYRTTLVELQKKIDKIEDEDENYRQNKKWIKYREQQDLLYKIIKKQNEVEDERNL